MSRSPQPFIPPDEQLARRNAVNPAINAFVSANAGSGKTTILASRILRLLLDGVDPSQILALTYTKAAAAEMQTRVFKELGRWVSFDDAALDEAITKIGGSVADADERKAARRLFARALETPGGLKIQTIHAFCESLLHLFPFEANVPARFTVLDDLQKSELMRQAVDGATVAALSGGNSPLGQALALLSGLRTPDGLTKWINEALSKQKLAVIHTAAAMRASPAGAAPQLRMALGIEPGETLETIDRAILEHGIPARDWPEIIRQLRPGLKTDNTLADDLSAALAETNLEARAALYAACYLTEKRKPLASIGTTKIDAALRERLSVEKERIAALIAKRASIELAERTEALFLFADAVRERFEAAKSHLGMLDFDDLIDKTDLLFQRAAAQWVLYKLDSRISHLLIDEAQDTSPRQWSILRQLTADFFSGFGQRGGQHRTIFAVGDEKQSIYSFQGASPEAFGAARKHYAAATRSAELEFKSIPFNLSFRTTPDVLNAVDAVFRQPDHHRGLGLDATAPVHTSARPGEAGFVEIWPAIPPPEEPELDAFAEVNALPQNAASLLLARRIAGHVALWIRDGHRFENDGARIRAGDVLILVRKRGAVFEALIRELKAQGVPVAGADRLKLTNHIAIEDLLVLADVMLNSDNDLALATLLRSPLIGLTDDDLIEITTPGLSRSLWNRVQESALPPIMEAAATLRRWKTQAERSDPFCFFAHILSAEGGRRKLLQRLGMDAAEALDVFLGDVMDWQRRNPPSLMLFTAAMRQAERDVKRDMDEAANDVRVMTIHGAKGLEARIVILADTFSAPAASQLPALLELSPARGSFPPVACLSSGVQPLPSVVANAVSEMKQMQDDEYRRLLYVAMTRAKDRLYITGFAGRKDNAAAWFRQIERSLAGHAECQHHPADDGQGEVIRYRSSKADPVKAQAEAEAPVTETAFPVWWNRPLLDAPPPKPPLRPSNLQDAAETAGRSRDSSHSTLRLRGTLVHALLEKLPLVPAAGRAAAGRALLEARNAPASDVADLLATVNAVLANEDFALLFGSNSRAEAAIAGLVPFAGAKGRPVRGRIDRLVVTAERVLCVDFKTGTPRETLDAAILRQLALYHALLSQIYPHHRVEAGILWTAGPTLIWAAPEALEAALQDIAEL